MQSSFISQPPRRLLIGFQQRADRHRQSFKREANTALLRLPSRGLKFAVLAQSYVGLPVPRIENDPQNMRVAVEPDFGDDSL